MTNSMLVRYKVFAETLLLKAFYLSVNENDKCITYREG